MNTNKKFQWHRLLALIIIPIAYLIFIFTPNLFAQKPDKEKSSIKYYRLNLVSEAPIYKGCDNLNIEFEIRECLTEKINNHFREHFNFEILKNLDYEIENKMIYIRFAVNENGEINESMLSLAPESEEINKEALRVINSIPKMTPGKLNGEPVGVIYRVVIDSSLEGEIVINGGSPVY